MGLFDEQLLPAAPTIIQAPSQVIATSESHWRPSPPPQLDNIEELYLDIESDGLEWWADKRVGGIGLCLPDGTTQYLPFRHQGGNNLDEAVVKRWAQTELKHKRLKNHSIKFDTHHLRVWGVDLEAQGCTVADIAFDAALLDDHRPPNKMSQADLCIDFLPESERKVTMVNGIALDPARMMSYPAEMVAVRCEADVRQVRLLDQIFAPKIRAEGLTKVQAVENRCIYPVCEMEKNGIPLDVPLLQQWHREVASKINQLMLEVSHTVGFACNPDSSKDMIRVFEKCSIPIVQSKKGSPTFTDDVLKRIEHPTIQLIRKIGKYRSILEKLTIYRDAVQPNGILRYHLHQLMCEKGGTATGRFSASDVNIQQVMKTKKQIAEFGDEYLLRQLFLPGSGLFLSADGRQIEYRIFAHYANSPRINAAFAADPLLNFHRLIFGMLSPHNASLIYEDTKNINFMRIYGGGLIKLALMMGQITEQEADELQRERDEWRAAQRPGLPPQPKLEPVLAIDSIYNRELPEVKPLLDKAKKIAETRGCVRTMLGRRGRFRPQDKRYSYKAFNIVGQGGGADIMKVKLIELHQARHVTGFAMRATVHDQVIGDVPDELAAEKVGVILDHQSFRLRVPILWEVKTGKNWKECD